MSGPQRQWHTISPEGVAQALSSDKSKGLNPQDARQRLNRHGRNVLPEGRKRTLLRMFLDQFRDMLVLILVAACLVSFAMKEVTDALVILAILVLNALLGVIQERKASRALEALKKMSVPFCEVIRQGATSEISSEEVVPGDLVVLREGDAVPADLRLTEVFNLRADEASLTGESAPVEKSAEVLAADATLPERTNMAYAGTHVTYGRGMGLVVATGMERQIGQIAALLGRQEQTVTPLARNLAGLGKLLGIITLATCAAVFAAGMLWSRNRPQQGLEAIKNMFMVSVSLAVAAIPEGLPAITTIVLALGVYRMSRHHAIVRKLPAVETLGCATYICTDKTGTLTQNRMTVTRAVTAEELLGGASDRHAAGRDELIRIAVLCNDAHIESQGDDSRRFGDPTELALLDYAQSQGSSARTIRAELPRLDELPFSSERKLMSTVHEIAGRRRLLVKGAPDVLLGRCGRYRSGDQTAALTAAAVEKIHHALAEMTRAALRVLAFAWKDLQATGKVGPDDEHELVFAGLMGMIDPPRPEAKAALAEAQSAGITTIMITGDNIMTARAIADDLGMLQEGDEVLSGRELEEISADQLRNRIARVRVFARVWPEQKIKIVQALQDNNEVVAMTGDGVNDAPAIKRADIGVAMGITGTDVAKETADVVLTDDNFATIVQAIEQGRAIFDNIRKFVLYLLACNLGEILVVFLPILIGLGSPLEAVQILLINLITDGLPALALGVDAPEPGIMTRRPRNPREGIVSRFHMKVILFNAVFIAGAVILSYLTGHVAEPDGSRDQRLAETMAFVTLTLAELSRAYSFRSETRNFWQINPFTNTRLLGAILLSGAIAVSTVLFEPLRGLFKTDLLTGAQWLIAIAYSLIPFAAFEAFKAVRRAGAPRR